MPGKVVTFGEIMLRLGSPDFLRLTQCDKLEMSFAGAEANVAVSLANYGIPVDYITRLPNNPLAEKCIMDLRAMKVGVDNIVRGGERIGVMYLETGSNFRPSHVYYDRTNSALAQIAPGMVDWRSIFNGASWFHWTGITPALSQSAADALEEAIDIASKMGLTISCDINYRGNLWQYGKSASEIMHSLVSKADIILGNEEDCEKVFGIKPENFDACRTDGDFDPKIFLSVCTQMLEKFPQMYKMVITLRGAISANHNTWSGVLFDRKHLLTSRRYDITHIVDRVGGGDSFMGALIYGLLHYDGDNQRALDFAVAASALKHTIKGDFNRVTAAEVESLLSGDHSGRVKR